jgi:hypothetical protein
MPKGRGLGMLLGIAALPCLLCSGMAALVVGPEFAATVLGIILALYLVIAGVGLVTWLSVGRGPSGPGAAGGTITEDDGREPVDPPDRPGR